MAINKVGSKGIEDGSVAAVDFAPNSVTSDKLTDGTITNANLSNSSVTVAGTSIALGASGTFNNKFIDWQSIVVSNGSTVTTMVAGKGYFVNNTSAAGLVKLPISASIGDVVAIKDYAGNFGTNSLTIQRNGHNIQGVANDSLISTNRASLVLVYVDSTKGWIYWEEHNVADLQAAAFITATGGTVTESGDFKIHSFTGDADFVVSAIGNPLGGPNSVDHLVVGGGGGGGCGGGAASGGGGAGGYRTSFPSPAGTIAVTAQTYPITVGAGGAGSTHFSIKGSTGSNSVFSTITSSGGGGGAGHYVDCGTNEVGANGASGGGGSGGSCQNGAGGSGNTPPVSPPQGNPGGAGIGSGVPTGGAGGGGGGGSNAAGGNGAPQTGGPGGSGTANSITGSSVAYAGGGGGASTPGGTRASAASGGGGLGGVRSGVLATDATANTGGGGGAQACNTNGSNEGGSGIVIIRYKFQ